MTVSPAAENYLYNVMGPYYASLAMGRSENVPSPFEEVERGYFLYPGSGRSSAPQAEAPADYTLDESSDREPDQPTTTGTQSKLSGTLGKIQTAFDQYVTEKVEQYMAFPEAINPLTGTSRVTGLSPALAGMMPGFFGPLIEAGYKANMENLSMLAAASQKSNQFSTGLVGNQLVGVQPTDTTLGGAVLEALGFDVEGYTLSGNIGGFTNVDTEAYEAALIDSLLGNQPTAYGPGRAVAMGLDPQVTYSQVELIQDVASKLGIDPFSPSSQYAFGGAYVPFVQPGGDRPDPTRPGGIVGSYDSQGNWKGVTSGTYTSVYGLPGMTDFAFYNMGAGYSAADMMNLEGTGGTDFSDIDYTGTGGAFTGDPVGMGDEYDDGSEFGGGSGPSFDDSSLGKGSGGGGDDKDFGGGFGGYGGDPDEGGYGAGRAMGGRIGYAPGGNVTNGFVNKDPDSVTEKQSIADNRFTSVKEGSFIVNQPTNEKYEGMLDSLVAKAKKKVKKSKDAPMVDVALSDGERHIEPEVVAEIEKMKGKSFLDDLNNKGKPEVRRREKKYGSSVGLNEGGIAEIDRGLVPQLVGPDRPKISGAPAAQGSGFIDQPPPSINDDIYFGRRFGDIKSAIQTVEIKGFEDNPFIFTGIKRKGAASSAFGPMQITASTLKDIKKRSKFYKMLGSNEKQYMDLLIQQGDDKVNIEKYRSMYRDGKKINTPKEIRKLYGRYGVGQIDPNLHMQHYDTIANITLMQKLQDHKTLKDALASYGEGTNYATKVLSALK